MIGDCEERKVVTLVGDTVRVPENDDDEVYPCDRCGKLRSKNQGGTTFTVCDECWERAFPKSRLVPAKKGK